MAIENKAKQIQASTRQYNQDIARQQRKRSDRSALKTLGLKTAINVIPKIANSYLASQTAEFLRDEQSILKEKREFGQALQFKKQILDVQKTITDSGSRSPEEWAYNNMKPVFTKRAEAYLSNAQTGPAGIYEALIDQEVRKLSKDWGTQFNLGLEKVNKLGTEEEFSTMFASAVKSARPSNFTDFATQGISNFFTGETKQSREQDAIKYISENLLSQNADAVNDFQKQYAKFKDTALAYDMTDLKYKTLGKDGGTLVSQKISKDELYLIEEKVNTKFDPNIGMFVYTKETIKTNRNTGSKFATQTNSISTETEETDLTKANMKTYHQKKVGERLAIFDPLINGQELLTPEAFELFVKQLAEEDKKLSNFENVEDYNNTMLIFQKYLETSNNVQSDSFDNVKIEIIKELVNDDILKFQDRIRTQREKIVSLQTQKPQNKKIIDEEIKNLKVLEQKLTDDLVAIAILAKTAAAASQRPATQPD